MNPQAEIREELARSIAIRDDKGFLNHNTLKYKITNEQYEFADRILWRLRSQDVVIRVTQKYPLKPHFIYEPLVKELTNEK